MTRPKKWYLKREAVGVQLTNSSGPLKKANAIQPLGCIRSCSVPSESTCGKFSVNEAVLFKCENGRIVLSIKHHEWNKTTFSAEFSGISLSSEFVSRYNELVHDGAESGEAVSPHSERPQSVSPPAPRIAKRSSLPSVSTIDVLNEDQPSPSKKLKFIKDGIDEQIERKRKGIMELPVSQLSPPPRESRLIREPDPTFVRNLKLKMVADPSAPGATPMAVLCKDCENPADFNAKYKNVYKYEVLGGMHTLMAKTQLCDEYPDNPYFKVTITDVYVGLSDEEALRLAQRHNLNSHFIHKVTHRDLVEACRARLYRMESRSLEEDETPPASAAWRESCKKAIIPQSISNTHCDAIFSQATLPRRVWALVVQVMDQFEQAKLKGQKLNLATLMSKPEFKQQYLAPIRCLDEEDQCTLLQMVIDGDCSLLELKSEAAKCKQMIALRTAFLRLTNTESWEMAQQLYPQFANDQQLGKYIHVDLKKSVPQSFSDFCQRAKVSNEAADSNDSLVVHHNTVSALVIEATKVTEISGQQIRKLESSFRGANLIIATVEENGVREEVESLAYTIKEVNAAFGLHLYTAAVVCNPSKLSGVQEVWEKAFINTEHLYVTNTSVSKLGVTSLTPCVTVVVLGLFSTDDEVKSDHFVYDQGDKRLNSITVSGTDELFTYIISHFSHPNALTLDITSSQGSAASAALTLGRNAICVVQKESVAWVIEKLHQLPDIEEQ